MLKVYNGLYFSSGGGYPGDLGHVLQTVLAQEHKKFGDYNIDNKVKGKARLLVITRTRWQITQPRRVTL